MLAVAALLAACGRERPAPPPPPQLATVQRFVERGVTPPEDARLTHGERVFVASEARPVLTSAQSWVSGLLCDPAPEGPKSCRAKRPAPLPAAPHAVFTLGGRSTHADIDGDHAATNTPDDADESGDARSVLLAPGAETPVGQLTPLQTLISRTYAIPALDERTLVTEPFTVPPGALLRLSIGVEESVWRVDSAPVFFRVVMIEENGAEQDLYRRILDPARNTADRRWYDNDVDMTDLAGRKLRLKFVTEPAQKGDTRPSLPLWGDPRLIAPHGGAARPSIVLVSLDTMRAKSTSLHGYALDTTPNLVALAARGTAFENAFTTFSNTLPSHMSMLTGLLPATHAVVATETVLGDEHVLLAETLRGAGYATAAFTEDALLDARRGFWRGFSAYYENTAIGAGAGDAEHTFGRAVEWAGRHADEPFFLFVHTYQVHFPYEPPAAYQSLFATPGDTRGGSLRAYEQEIRYADDVLQRLVDGLRRVVPDERLLLVVTADHGEEFGEHGLLTHNQLFDEVMHVPLVFLWPGRVAAGRRVSDLVSLIDIAPTLLQLAGVPAPPGLEGLSLVPLLTGAGGTLPRDTVLGEYPPTSDVQERHFVARSRDAKCIVTPGGASDACWDLRADPGEKSPRPPRETEALAKLHEAARAYAARSMAARPRFASGMRGHAPGAGDASAPAAGQPAPAPANEAVEQKMRALGYVQ